PATSGARFRLHCSDKSLLHVSEACFAAVELQCIQHCHHSVEHGKEVATPHATYFSDVPRGSTKVAVLKSIPHMTAPLWWDRRRSVPIHDARLSPLDGWGEIHDQLRLQRYSLQLSVVFRKYYKTIFLGLVDMTIVNTFTIYREACKQRNEPPADHAMFLRHLQEQRLELTASNFADVILSLTASVQTETLGSNSTEHKLTMFQDWNQFGDQKQHPKQPQHQCKVCSI
ncbi:hypothetical protein L914_01113, partial [Phytophthora nicotianae]